ncbi:MAG: hypothetical protein BJ554DRAFT_4763 [Olpidium bornovanus]|uniref:Uncharacterized protein n=1 Tax=Olpidium bornovanus TaxID=278681 RepID=A0A8H8A070_9FUNG|nr:MAG: hypothetical protein BJ554DRAFT_4763 [Olpidium bornovanus]
MSEYTLGGLNDRSARFCSYTATEEGISLIADENLLEVTNEMARHNCCGREGVHFFFRLRRADEPLELSVCNPVSVVPKWVTGVYRPRAQQVVPALSTTVYPNGPQRLWAGQIWRGLLGQRAAGACSTFKTANVLVSYKKKRKTKERNKKNEQKKESGVFIVSIPVKEITFHRMTPHLELNLRRYAETHFAARLF